MKFTRMKFDNQMRKIDAKVQHFFDWLNKPTQGWESVAQNAVVFGAFLLVFGFLGLFLNWIGN